MYSGDVSKLEEYMYQEEGRGGQAGRVVEQRGETSEAKWWAWYHGNRSIHSTGYKDKYRRLHLGKGHAKSTSQ